jgi:hypothetical protein
MPLIARPKYFLKIAPPIKHADDLSAIPRDSIKYHVRARLTIEGPA